MKLHPHQKAVFNAFFAEHLPQLSDKYKWPLKKPKQPLRVPTSGHELHGNGMDECIALKKHLTQEWDKATEVATKKQLAQWIVSDWGGVRTNGHDTIDRYITSLTSGDFAMPLQGVASYSKILSMVNCQEYAIYDARVVAALNAVQVLYGQGQERYYFPHVPSRNKDIKAFAHWFPKNELSKGNWQIVSRDKAYQTYNRLLQDLKAHHTDTEIYHFEMTLFSMAPELCKSVLHKLGR